MSDIEQSPFVPGARVAVTDYHGDGWREDFVEKSYKTGRFTLRGSKQQWKPWRTSYGERIWSATPTGENYSRRRLSIWDETTDKEITARVELNKTRERWRILRSKVDRIQAPNNALCDAIDAALSAFPIG